MILHFCRQINLIIGADFVLWIKSCRFYWSFMHWNIIFKWLF